MKSERGRKRPVTWPMKPTDRIREQSSAYPIYLLAVRSVLESPQAIHCPADLDDRKRCRLVITCFMFMHIHNVQIYTSVIYSHMPQLCNKQTPYNPKGNLPKCEKRVKQSLYFDLYFIMSSIYFQ